MTLNSYQVKIKCLYFLNLIYFIFVYRILGDLGRRVDIIIILR